MAWKIRGLTLGRVKTFFTSPKHPQRNLWPTHSPNECVPGLFPTDKRRGGGTKLTAHIRYLTFLKISGNAAALMDDQPVRGATLILTLGNVLAWTRLTPCFTSNASFLLLTDLYSDT